MINLGYSNEIVGVSSFCPLNKPKVADKKINWEELLKLKPTYVFMLKSQATKKGLKILEKLKIKIGTYSFENLKSIPFSAMDMANLLGDKKRGREIFKKFMKDLKNLPKVKTKRVLYIIWQEPFIVSTNSSYIGETLQIMGFDVFPKNKRDFIKVSLEEIFNLKPDIIFISDDMPKINNLILKNIKTFPLPSNIINRPTLIFFKPLYNLKNEIFFN